MEEIKTKTEGVGSMNAVDAMPMVLVFACFITVAGNLLFHYYMARRV